MNYKEVIESRYNRQAWQQLLHDIFRNRVTFYAHPVAVQTSNRLARQAFNLGRITLADGEGIAVYEVELADTVDMERNRRGIRDMLTANWRGLGYAGAFMFCHRREESVLRFSYVSEAWTFADDGTYQKESTDTRRFTYLLGEGHRSRTAISQFEKLRDSGLRLRDLTKAFSVEAVGDMFFRDYKQQYEDIIAFITGKRMVKQGNKWEERTVGEPCREIFGEFRRFGDPEKAVRDYVKKLMGRLVFLQFLQKKGWLGVPVGKAWGEGDHEFIQRLFADTVDKDHFIDRVLEVLFRDINTRRVGDLVSPEVGKDIRVPYLNGGLFEEDAYDSTAFPLPARYMQAMLDFFASYNFTIDENDPDDAEVGVDPEMLGRIFENLLEDNKDKGAFYTPKEIVAYMCQESLTAYLQTGIADEAVKAAICDFVKTHRLSEALPVADILQRLKDVKICDPAIGSGAFPMGLLKELYLCRAAIEGFDQAKAAQIKKHIIQQNIYGVDIERGAVDIARLRFWLSLIVDEENPEALPNLDFKIMQGNSLLEQYKGADLSAMTERKTLTNESISFFENMLDVLRKNLRDLLEEYYDCPDHVRKAALRKEIAANVKQQLAEQSIAIDFANLDLSANSEFFLWHTWFHDVFKQGGFDIVIGNPPYGAKLSKYEKTLYRLLYPETQFKVDTYSLFVLLSLKLMAKDGVCYYIIPNTLLDNFYEEKVREKLLKDNRIIEICDLSDSVFSTAVVHSMIIGYKCEILKGYDIRIKTETLACLPSYIPSKYFLEQPQYSISYRNYAFQGLFDKLASGSVRLESVVDIRQTIKTGNDKKWIAIGKRGETYKPILRGKDICRYGYCFSGRYVNYGKHLANPIRSDIFEQPKILIREAGATIVATYDDDNYYIMSSLYNLTLKNNHFSLKYLLALINSKVFQFVMNKITFEKTKGAFTKARIFHYYALPVKFVDKSVQDVIAERVDKIMDIKRKDFKANIEVEEHQIDLLVYHLYGLTYDEVLVIDPATRITREEYENVTK